MHYNASRYIVCSAVKTLSEERYPSSTVAEAIRISSKYTEDISREVKHLPFPKVDLIINHHHYKIKIQKTIRNDSKFEVDRRVSF